MEEIKKLNVSICDLSYKEGLEEIIAELKTIQIDTLAMNETSHARLFGRKEMLEAIINYLERCL
jgi:hypothetical protein